MDSYLPGGEGGVSRCVAGVQREEKAAEPVCVFPEALFEVMREDEVVVSSNGSACVCAFQAAQIKEKRIRTNSGCAAMGYGLPGAIGAATAAYAPHVTCIEKDGSIQMNLQELQTVVYHDMPMLIVVLNNNGYHSIRQTQSGFFGMPLHGVSGDSGSDSLRSRSWRLRWVAIFPDGYGVRDKDDVG